MLGSWSTWQSDNEYKETLLRVMLVELNTPCSPWLWREHLDWCTKVLTGETSSPASGERFAAELLHETLCKFVDSELRMVLKFGAEE